MTDKEKDSKKRPVKDLGFEERSFTAPPPPKPTKPPKSPKNK